VIVLPPTTPLSSSATLSLLTPSWRALSCAMSMRSTFPGSFQSKLGLSMCGLDEFG